MSEDSEFVKFEIFGRKISEFNLESIANSAYIGAKYNRPSKISRPMI